MTPLGKCIRGKLLAFLEPLPSHDLFCPEDRVQNAILTTLQQRGPSDFAALEHHTRIAPEYLEDEAINLGGKGYITVERRYRRRLFGKPASYLFFTLTPLGRTFQPSGKTPENRSTFAGSPQISGRDNAGSDTETGALREREGSP